MSEITPETPAPTEAPAPAAAREQPVVPAAPEKADKPSPSNPWDDPKAAQAEIERLRRENGADRVNAKTKAAEEARKELAQTIGKALGLVEDEPIDPAKLTAQLTQSQTQARQAQVELAVFRAASDTDADPAALLDSRTFLAKVADIDPTDGEAIKQAIADVVASNPRLGKAPHPGMKPNPAQGRSASPPLGLADQIAAAQKAGDMKAVMRLKAAQAVGNSIS